MWERGSINLSVFVSNAPSILLDVLGLAPGDGYSSPDEAARAAMEYIGPYVCYQNRDRTPPINANEAGGRIYYDPATGKYSFTVPILSRGSGVDVGSPPAGALDAGIYHIHHSGTDWSGSDKAKASTTTRLYFLSCSQGTWDRSCGCGGENAHRKDTFKVHSYFNKKAESRYLDGINTCWDGEEPGAYYMEGDPARTPPPEARWAGPPTPPETVYGSDGDVNPPPPPDAP